MTSAETAPLEIDFARNKLHFRISRLQGSNELIAKAIGFKPGKALSVLDATAGLGVEAFLLAALGCKVTLCERHPIVANALQDALSRGLKNESISPIISNMALYPMCAMDYLEQNPDCLPEVIYCDPMFAPRKKHAAVKKSMQILQSLVGQDDDATRLIDLALQRAQKRVVVKRAKADPPLRNNPTFSIHGRSHRFDIYALSRV